MDPLTNKVRKLLHIGTRLPFIIMSSFVYSDLVKKIKYRYKYGGQINYQANIVEDSSSFIRIGVQSSIGAYTEVVLQENSKIIISDNTSIGRHCEIGGQEAHIFIGSNTSIQDRCTIVGNIHIGRNCIFSKNVLMTSGRHHFGNYPYLTQRDQDAIQESEKVFEEKITIEDDCFVGVGVHIKHGITLAKGTIVGANSVVTHNYPPYSIIGGIPARLIKKRLDYTPPSEISVYKEETYPYFYDGMNMQRKYVKKNIQNYDGVMVDPNFILDLAILGTSKIVVRMKKICSETAFIKYGEYSLKLSSIMSDYEFLLREQEDSKLRFEIVGNSGILDYSAAALESAKTV